MSATVSIAIRALVACAIAVAVLAPSRAEAHQAGLSQGRYDLDGATLVAHVTLANAELAAALPALDADASGAISAAELARGRDVVAREIAGRARVTGDGEPCPVALVSATPTEQDGVDVEFAASCAARPAHLSIHCGFLDVLPASHRHIAAITTARGAPPIDALAVAAAPDLDVDVGGHGGARTASFFALLRMGVEHILTGYDHLVFLFGLVVMGGRTRSLVVALTAFTVAHSISLALAALGVWAPRPSIVEPAIALSIAYVGVENLLRARAPARAGDPARGRWHITLPFGLVHGFGFAGALAEIDLPRARIPAALLAFNVGVEIGQLVVLALALPLLAWARKWRVVREPGTMTANVAIVAAGLAWFVARVWA